MLKRANIERAGDGIVTPAFTAITGYSSEETVGQHSRILKSGRQAVAYYQKLWKTIQSGKQWHGDIVNRGSEKTRRQVRS